MDEVIEPFRSGYIKSNIGTKLADNLKRISLFENQKKDLTKEWDKYDFYSWDYPEIKELNEIQVNLVYKYQKEFTNSKQSKAFRFKGWVNLRKGTDWHEPHNHSYVDLIFNTYISTPKNTEINFQNPDYAKPFNVDIHKIKPEVGDIILTPGWWIHWTSPSYMEDWRISMSSNVFML